MFEFFEAIVVIIVSVIGYVGETILNFVKLIALAVKIVVFISETIVLLPVFMTSFLVLLIGVYVFKFIARMGK